MRLRPLYLLLLPVLTLNACDTLTGDDDVTITIVEDDPLNLQVGQSETLTVQDGSGNTITANQVTWSSSDTTVATVSAAGVVTAKQAGTTQVQAGLGGATDAIQVAVSFEANANQMLINVSGPFQELYVIDAVSFGTDTSSVVLGMNVDFLDRSSWNFGYLFGSQWISTATTGAGVVFVLPDDLAAGTYSIQAAPADFSDDDLLNLSTPLAVFFRETEDAVFEYRPTSGTLQITAVDVSGPDFNPTGTVEGTATFQADEYEEVYNETTDEFDYAATGRTIEVDVTFNVPAGTYRTGYMDMSASGGPYPSTLSVDSWADAWYDSGFGLEIAGWAESTEGDLYTYLDIASPAAGTFTIGSGAETSWTEYSDTDYLDAGGESGTVTVSQYSAPTETSYGVVRGTMDVTYRVHEFSPRAPGEAFTVTGSFAVPVAPGSTLDQAAADVAGSHVLQSPLARHLPQSLLPGQRSANRWRSNR